MTPIITHAAALFGIGVQALSGPGRSQRLVEARQAVCYAAHKRGWSSYEIAEALNRDHSTVLHNRKVAERRAITDSEYALLLAALL